MKKKYFITGVSGFVSRHFMDFLDKNNIRATILGVDVEPYKNNFRYTNLDTDFKVLNLLEKEKLERVISEFQPDYILHCASYSSVAYSWQNPVTSFTNNTNIFLNVLEVVRESCKKCRILSIGSSEEYGRVLKKHLPLRECHSLQPVSPYAVARVSQELLSKIYASGYGLDIIMTRSFNHIGPGQKENFVIASFVNQLLKAKLKGAISCKLVTGDTSIVRDFLDVRDVVEAYYLLLQKGKTGEVYNICRGEGKPIKSLIVLLSELLEMKVTTEVDVNMIRPVDNRMIIGSYAKIKRNLGWEPRIPLRKSLQDMIDHVKGA